jgi:hypothetical protein
VILKLKLGDKKVFLCYNKLDLFIEQMSIFKHIFAAFFFQLFLFIITMGFFVVTQRFLPPTVVENFLLGIYSPFFFLVVNAANMKGESTMIEAPVFAFILGSGFYSLFFGFIYYFYKLNKNTYRAEKGDWQKSREILAKAPNVKTENFDKI